jgi:hypothetical protein
MKKYEIELQLKNIIYAISLGFDYNRLENLFDYYVERLNDVDI